jgi:hypothetical protein
MYTCCCAEGIYCYSPLQLPWAIFMMGSLNFFIYLILPAALGAGVYSVSSRNEYPKQKKKIFLGSRAQPVREADNLTAICKLIV